MSSIPVLNSFLKQFKEDFDSFEQGKDNPRAESYLKALRRDLDSDFEKAKEMHNEILKKKASEQITAYLEANTFQEIRSIYYKYWAEIDSLLQNFAIRGEDPNQTLNTTFRNYNDAKPFKLPVIELPKFSGDYKEWRNFYKLFDSLVHKNRNLDKIQKFSYLHTHLKGEALDVISNLELEEANYDCALELLTNRYNHTRMLVFLQLSTLFHYQPISKESTAAIKDLLNVVNDCILQLRRLNEPVDYWDSILIFLLSEKIPKYTKYLWNNELKSRTDVPKYKEFYEFLTQRFRTLEMNELMDKDIKTSMKNFHIQSNSNSNSSKKQSKIKCPMCNGAHYLNKCFKFSKLNFKNKQEIVKKNKLCSNCLTNSHTLENCYSKRTCSKCNKRHHTLLHYDKLNANLSNDSNHNGFQRNDTNSECQNSNSNLNSSLANNPQVSQTFYVSGRKNIKLLGTALVKVYNNQGDYRVVRALVDPCSDDNYVSNSLVKSLNLRKQFSPTVVSVLGDLPGGECPFRSIFTIKSNYNEFKTEVSAAVTDTISLNIPTEVVDTSKWVYLNGLQLADPNYHETGKVDLLLGISIYSQIIQQGLVRGENGNPFATQTVLGWLVRGDTNNTVTQSRTFATFSKNTIETQLSKFWELEQFVDAPPNKPEDELCEQLFQDSVTIDSDNRFCVKLPFKNGVDPILGNSKQIALQRFINMERKLNSKIDLKLQYDKTMKEYLDNGYMIEVPSNYNINNKQYFLPHHAVIKESSSTTKVRVVFDASCKTSDGKSLNDHMLTGPKLQKDISEILFNWRKYKFALSADIARMYLQFRIDQSHYPYQKILWRFSPSDPIKEYFLTTITFGTSAAPYLAMRLLSHLASQEFALKEFPIACQTIKNEFYVDDLLSGGHSIQNALDKYNQILSLLSTVKLSIRKWCSNSNSILEKIPNEIKEVSEIKEVDENNFRKTLGMFWSPREDIFSFSIDIKEYRSTKLTKRKVLSMIARLYDPLGFISPTIMYAKQIMKKIWLTNNDWDSEINSEIKFDVSQFMNNLEHLKSIKIPRWNGLSNESSPIKLIGFCDASVKGFGAVVYLQNENDQLILLTSKTRVAPTKFVTVARLELCGALLLAELLHWCCKLYSRTIQVDAFCDSKIVLSWLSSHPSRWKTFVAHRISKIQTFSNYNWHYVNTKVNPADLASRGVLPSALPECSLWWNGPNLSDLDFAPFSLQCSDEELQVSEVERNKNVCLCSRSNPTDLSNKYSSFSKLCSIVKQLSNFIIQIYQKLILKNQDKKQFYQNKIEFLHDPEIVVLRIVQKSEFHCEIKCLINKKPLPNNSKLLSLTPFIDGFGILRVGGRLQNSNLTYNEKHPIILPPYHQQTINLIREAHNRTLHGGNKLVWSFLRRKYFILRAQDRIRKILNECVPCIRYKRISHEQLMGNLPTPRVSETRAFFNSGVDYAGPLNLKMWKGRCNKISKAYICVFVCLSTKALHLELVTDLSSESFLAAFKRFVFRRGHVENLYSDNGTNFVGASKILNDECRKAERQWKLDLEGVFSKLSTKWHFIPPSSPHFGGLWEAGVKSVKTHLIKTVGKTSITYEECLTLLVQIEGILNSRPLCPMSNDPDNYSALTPAHFLIGEPIVGPPEPQIELKNHPLRRWQLIQRMFQQFSKEYRKEYLQRLINRPKWQNLKYQFKPNDLVLLTENTISPTDWPMARILQIHPGKDDITRVVTLRTQNKKIFKRPISKIRLLPIQNYEN